LKGLDDYLCQHTIDEFKTLPKKEIRKQSIQEMIQGATLENLPEILKRMANLKETEKAVLINILAKKLEIPKRSIQQDIEKLKVSGKEHLNIDRLLESGTNPQSQFSAQNFLGGILSYGAILGNERVLVQSDGNIVLADESRGDLFRFKRSSITAETIKRFQAREDVNGKELLNRIKSLFIDHVVFRDDRIPLLLSVWVFGTYLYKLFHFYAYLWINSPVKRCGKSLLLDILSYIAFNATPRLVNPSESSVFREVDANDATLIIDEVESLSHSEKDQKSELISLINSGFQKGSQASRVETRNREFIVVYFNSYSPKVLAGVKGVADTVEDRSLKIMMARKTKLEVVKRFNLRSMDSHIKRIKEDLFIWALHYAEDVIEVYDQNLEFPGTESLDDRLKDILEPLLSIASVIDAQADETKNVKILTDLAVDMRETRENQEALTGSIPAVVGVMESILNGKDESFISSEDLFSKFQLDEDLNFIESKKRLASFLSKLDLYRAQPKKVDGKTTRGYSINKKWVDGIRERYV
jgi:hypothetical protein